jgi:hypothetical protein
MKASFYASMAALPLFSRSGAQIITYLLVFLLFSFAYTSYVLIPKHKIRDLFQKTAKTLYENYKILLPVYLFTAVVLLGEYYLFMKSMAFGGYIPVIFAVVVIFPSIAWSRFYAIKAVEK